MDESSSPFPVNPWYRRLAIVFLFLFALLWSIDSFFFVTLIGLSAACGVLSINSSAISFPFFGKSEPVGSGPGTNGRSPLSTVQPFKIIRIFIFVLGVTFFFFMMIGIINGNDEHPSESVSDTDVSNSDRGTNFYNEGSYDSAMLYYDKALVENGHDLDAQYGKALTYFSKGDLDASRVWTRKSISTKSDYNLSWWLLGDIYYTRQQYDSAAIYLERAYSYQTDDVDFYQLMAQNYEALDNKQRAIEFYKKIIEKDPTRTEAYEHLMTLDPDNAESYKILLDKLK